MQAFFQHTVPGQFADARLRTTAAQKGLHMRDFDFGLVPATAKFEISLQTAALANGCCQLRWEHMQEAVPAAAIHLLNRHLAVMARRLATTHSPELPTTDLARAPCDERKAMHSWTSSEALPLPDRLRLEDLLLQQAARTPKQTAVSMDGVNVSFHDLTLSARKLATVLCAALAEACSDAKQLVMAVLAHRCAELPVALMAVLLVGAAFVPLSPENPVERLSFMVAEAGAVALLATSRVAELGLLIVSRSDPPVVLLKVPELGTEKSADVDGAGAPSSANLVSRRSQAVYVLFTSGSTGRPKGVSLSHRALLSHLLPYVRTVLQASDRVLLTSPFSFDMAYSQLFGALLSGATLILTRENPMVDPAELYQIMRRSAVTFTTVVPSVLSAMVHLTTESLELPSLRHLGCGGEPMASAAADYSKRALGSRMLLHNRYGPTECAINALLMGPSSLHEMAAEEVPIGWASSHRHIHLKRDCDEDAEEQELLSLGLDGELLLGGPGVARGYVARPELTQNAFRDSLRGAGKNYLTGDLVAREHTLTGLRGCLQQLCCNDGSSGTLPTEAVSYVQEFFNSSLALPEL